MPTIYNKVTVNGDTLIDLSGDTVASAADIVVGKVGHLNTGATVTGTATVGASAWTKIAETSYQVSTTSTTTTTIETWATGHSEIWTSDKILYIRVRDTAGKRAGYYYGYDGFFETMIPKNGGTSTSTSTGLMFQVWSVTSAGAYSCRDGTGTGGYGVYPDSIYSNGSIRIRSRYNSNYSRTINGTYKVEVYLLDPPTGAPIFT